VGRHSSRADERSTRPRTLLPSKRGAAAPVRRGGYLPVGGATRPPRRRFLVPIISIVAALAIVAAGLVAWQAFGARGAPAAAAGCTSVARLAVTVDTSIAPIVTDVANRYDAEKAHCAKITVTGQDSADTASVLAAGGAGIDVWIPNSLVWVDRMNSIAGSLGREPAAISVQQVVATSPVVFAIPADKAAQAAADPLTWGRVLDGSLPAVLPNPEASSSSLAGMLALAAHAGKNTLALNAALIDIAKTIPATPDDALAAVATAPALTAAITTEQQVAAYDTAHPQQQVSAVYPKDGTDAVEYPYLVVNSSAARGVPALVTAFEQALLAQSPRFVAAGFRDGSGAGTLNQPGVPAAAVAVAPATDGTTQLALYQDWSVLTLRGRMLGVIDTSGSMSDAAGGGLSRIQIFQQAAMGAISRFSGDVELGLWTFSTDQNGTLPYQSISPIAPLGDKAHAADLAAKIAGLPARVGGNTGLYDTVLAAVREVRSTYDPKYINSVVVITDGVNDDAGSSTTLQSLIATLKKEADPKRPVPVILIGFGPDTDIASMTQIAKATGGGAYSASKPQDLSTVLTLALTQRSCRPNCGK